MSQPSKPYRPGMILMPGESTHIDIPVPPEIAEQLRGGHLQSASLEEVPPPKQAPIQDIAETLGLCAGLRAERIDHQYRCDGCNAMQPSGSWLVWVPDGVRRRDPEWSVTEACRQIAFNGSGSGWCLSCARSFKRQMKPSDATARRSWWSRLFDWHK